MGSDWETSSVCVDRNSTWPESSATVTMVVGDGMLDASEAQRNWALTWPTRVPLTPPRCSTRRSMKVRAGPPSPTRQAHDERQTELEILAGWPR